MQILGHRGFSSDYPENTMLAFQKAIDAGADGFEFDVKLSKDGVIVVMHDSSVDRTTNGVGTVSSLTLSELKSLDAGIKKGIAFENEPIPTLHEVLDKFGKETILNIELTNYGADYSPQLASSVADLLKNYGYGENIMVSSFLFKNLSQMKEALPDIQCALLTQKGIKGFFGRNVLNHSLSIDALHPEHSDVTPGLIKRERQCGRKIRTWTVDDMDEILKLDKMDIDAVMTDNPLGACKILGHHINQTSGQLTPFKEN